MLSAVPASDVACGVTEVEAASSAWLVDGRYLTIAPIGQGGMADVFTAQDTVLRRVVALKVFRQRSALRDVRERSQHEVCTVARLNHPNLVTVLDAGVHAESVPYLVMELVDGPSLAQRILEGPLDPTDVANIGAQVAAALCYIHACDIVHCDVKPANILLGRGENGPGSAWIAKLTDFGIAQKRDARSSPRAGVTVGTASYLSPEQVRNDPLGPGSDIYSLGLVLLEALTGHRMYDGQPVAAAVARLRQAPDVPASLGVGWTALLTAMTTADPTARPSAQVVTATLRGVAADQAPEPLSLLESLFAAEADDSSESTASPGPVSAGGHRWRKGLIRTAYATIVPAAAVATVLVIGNPVTESRHAQPPAAAAAPRISQARPAPAAPAPVHVVPAAQVAAAGVAVAPQGHVAAAPATTSRRPVGSPRAAPRSPATKRVPNGTQSVSKAPKPTKLTDLAKPGKPKRHGPGGKSGTGRQA